MKNKAKKYAVRMSLLTPAFLVGLLVFLPFGAAALAASVSPEGIINLVNSSRKEAGLQPVVENNLLNEAAKAKAKDMIQNDYFAHTSPDGQSPWHWFKKAGYDYKYAGENLAINYTSAKEQHTAWMKSPTHRANILNEKYQEIGIAVVEGKIDGETSLVTVQLFGTRMKAVADKTSSAIPPQTETFAASGEVKGSEAEFIGAPVPMTQTLKEASFPAETRGVDIGMAAAAVLFFSLVAAPLIMVVRSMFFLREFFERRSEDEYLFSAALYFALNDFLRQQVSRKDVR